MATRKKLTIADTADLMVSEDYVDRFRAEYHQLRDRREKLIKMITDYHAGKLNFEPDCSIELLMHQVEVMQHYQTILEMRAKIEKIKL